MCRVIALLLVMAGSAQAQSLDALQALPAGTEVFIQDQRGASSRGLLQTVDAVQLTIARDTRSYAIGRDRISRAQVRKPDPLWNALIIGFVGSVAAHAAYGSGWSDRERVWNYVGGITVPVLFALSHTAKQTIYRTP